MMARLYRCDRCGSEMPSTETYAERCHIQVQFSPAFGSERGRMDWCRSCEQDFRRWLQEGGA